MVETAIGKKRKVSKKTKKSWRKHVDVRDVDAFLEDERLEERLGAPYSTKKDDELFTFDRERDEEKQINNLTKQQRRALLKNSEPKCFALLKPLTAVPDPIAKRNRVRTPEERKSLILKNKEAERILKGHLKLKEKMSIRDKLSAAKRKAEQPKRGDFNLDIWEQEPVLEPQVKSEWLTSDTVRHTLANTGKKRKRIPKSLHAKPSVLPAISKPHPGTSYNPARSDHQKLLQDLAADEMKIIKQEKHLERVTSKMFRKVTQEEKELDNLKEMSQGLPIVKEESESEDEDDDPTVKSVNPPVKNEKKTLVQRRKIKEQQKLLQEKLKKKIEKKKIADIYHLNHIGKQISKIQKKQETMKQKKLKLKAKKALEPKVLSRHKFEPAEQEFLLSNELSGNLRNAQPAGNLLKDRYKSLQQRNIVAPTTLVLKKNKPNVKKFIKSDHKIDVDQVLKENKGKGLNLCT